MTAKQVKHMMGVMSFSGQVHEHVCSKKNEVTQMQQLTAGPPLLSALGPLGVAFCWTSSTRLFLSAECKYQSKQKIDLKTSQ